MANVLGSSTPNVGKQAPPPPPLPAGMSIVSQNEVRMQAPPPPPLPAGLHAIGEAPTVRNESIKQNDFAKQNALRQVDGRPKMSLAEMMSASAQEAVEPIPSFNEPVAKVNGGNLSVGNYCFARSGMDGLYYHARIESIDDTGADVVFFDESREHVIFSKIYTAEIIPKVMQCFANWNNKGSYYPAKVVDFPENGYTVVYDENPDIKDTLGRSWTRFAPW